MSDDIYMMWLFIVMVGQIMMALTYIMTKPLSTINITIKPVFKINVNTKNHSLQNK